MSVLLLVEHGDGKLRDATLPAVTAAAKLGEVHVLVAGSNVGSVAEEAAKIAGVAKVVVADAPHLDHDLAENVAPVAVKLMEGYDAFVAPATTFGKNIAPRVAALLDVMQISDVLSVEGADTFTRPIYAGNAIATVRTSDAKKVLTVRSTAFDKAARDGGSAQIEQVPATGDSGVDRPGERVLAFDRQDVGDLHHVEQGGDPRRDVLSGRGCRREKRVVMLHQLRRERRDILRQRMLERRIVGDVDLADAGDLGGLFRDWTNIRAGDEQMHLAELRGGSHRGERRIFDLPAFMFDEDERLHPTTPVSRILSMSSSTEPTLIPAWRFDGSATLSVLSRGAVSMP